MIRISGNSGVLNFFRKWHRHSELNLIGSLPIMLMSPLWIFSLTIEKKNWNQRMHIINAGARWLWSMNAFVIFQNANALCNAIFPESKKNIFFTPQIYRWNNKTLFASSGIMKYFLSSEIYQSFVPEFCHSQN